MTTVRDLIAKKGSLVHTVPASATVLDATRRMIDFRIGSLVVMRDDRIAGIFTERDVLRRVVAEERSPAATRVEDIMSRDVFCCDPDTDIDEASRILRDRRIRHLPVRDGDELIGIVSIGDINAHHASDQEARIRTLNDFLYTQV